MLVEEGKDKVAKVPLLGMEMKTVGPITNSDSMPPFLAASSRRRDCLTGVVVSSVPCRMSRGGSSGVRC